MTLEVILNISDDGTDVAKDLIGRLQRLVNANFDSYEIIDYTTIEEPIVEDDDEEDDPED